MILKCSVGVGGVVVAVLVALVVGGVGGAILLKRRLQAEQEADTRAVMRIAVEYEGALLGALAAVRGPFTLKTINHLLPWQAIEHSIGHDLTAESRAKVIAALKGRGRIPAGARDEVMAFMERIANGPGGEAQKF